MLPTKISPAMSALSALSALTARETHFLQRALCLAANGLYSTTPNPRVGCVVVRGDTVLSEGWHQQAGGNHAEINALQPLSDSDKQGADIYISLEPCANHGRTPPCVDAIIAAQPNKVVVAMLDPNPATNGKSIAKLQAANIPVKLADGALQQQAESLNIGFISRMKRHRPWVRSKIALSLDGKTALANGISQWISNEEARHDAHHWRAQSCAILTGIGTAEIDNPRLTVRHQTTNRQPLRILVDSTARARPDLALFSDNNIVWVGCPPAPTPDSRTGEYISLPHARHPNKVDLTQLMHTLAQRGVNEVLVEAGRKLNGALLQDELIDELVLYIAPCLFGEHGKNLFAIPSPLTPADAVKFKLKTVDKMGEDNLRLIYRRP